MRRRETGLSAGMCNRAAGLTPEGVGGSARAKAALLSLVRRDVTLALRIGGGGGVGLAFFVLVVVLVPLGVGSETGVLAQIAGGMVWVAALLAALLTLDRLFQADFEDGALDQMMLAPLALEQIVLAKATAHWLTTGLPITVVGPLLGASLALPVDAVVTLAIALVIGTPALSLIGAVGAAILVNVRRGGLLLSVLVLPLYIPTLIFGSRAVENTLLSLDATAALALTGAVSLVTAALAPFAAATALRTNAQ